jgi:hypothetical protein
MVADRSIERLLLLFIGVVVAFIIGAYVGRCDSQYDTVYPCVPSVAVAFEPIAGGWVDEYGHLVMALEYEDALPWCDAERG